MVVCGQDHTLSTLPQGRDPVPIVQEAGWAPGLVWMGVETFGPIGIQSPASVACSESLYWLCEPSPHVVLGRGDALKCWSYFSRFVYKSETLVICCNCSYLQMTFLLPLTFQVLCEVSRNQAGPATFSSCFLSAWHISYLCSHLDPNLLLRCYTILLCCLLMCFSIICLQTSNYFIS